jgi:flagellin-like hook-associated protein FlgL
MADSIVLAAALRNNLLSLQNTQSLIDKTQLRLSTGLKVNSALDDPQNFFAARALNNRASDLTRLLDGIGQSIKTIETADQGITALTKLVEQAQSVVNSARDEIAANAGTARLTGNVDLSAVSDLTTLTGIATGETFTIATTNDAGTRVSETLTIITGDTAYTLAAKITDQFADNRAGEVFASVNDDGHLVIESTNGRSFKIQDATGITLSAFTSLGIGDSFEDETRTAAAATTLAATTVVAGNTVSSISLYESSGNLAEAGDVLVGTSYIDQNGTTVLANLAVGDTFNFTVNNSGTITTGAVAIGATTTFQDLVDQINETAAVNTYISAEFDEGTSQIKFTSLQDTVDNLQIAVNDVAITTGVTFDIGLGDGNGTLDPVSGQTVVGINEYVVHFNNSTENLDNLAKDYNNIRDQIDKLVVDANYRGTNLLKNDQLTTYFNEDNSNFLTTEGVDFTANGLDLTEATFRSSSAIELNSTQVRSALEDVRSFGATLANNLAIIQTRQDFTKQTVNTLKAGAGELTVADQNEEGANLLALQTRQALGVTALSLASQSQQSVLRLF